MPFLSSPSFENAASATSSTRAESSPPESPITTSLHRIALRRRESPATCVANTFDGLHGNGSIEPLRGGFPRKPRCVARLPYSLFIYCVLYQSGGHAVCRSGRTAAGTPRQCGAASVSGLVHHSCITWPEYVAHPDGVAPLDGRTSGATRPKAHAPQARLASQPARPSSRPKTDVSRAPHPLPTSVRSFRSSSNTPKSGNAASLSASPQSKSGSPAAATIILRAVASSSEDGG